MKNINEKCCNIYLPQDLIECESYLRKSNKKYYFRGQFDNTWIIESTLRRNLNKQLKSLNLKDNEKITTELLINEQRFFSKFASNNFKEKNELEVLSELQHSGLPTILIDFTESFWIALWFAISENDPNFRSNDQSAFKLYYFETNGEIEKDFNNSSIETKKVFCCESDKIPNIKLQKSVFIIDNCNEIEKEWEIKSITIPYYLKQSLLHLLKQEKIIPSKLFDGLKGIYYEFENYCIDPFFSFALANYESNYFSEGKENFKIDKFDLSKTATPYFFKYQGVREIQNEIYMQTAAIWDLTKLLPMEKNKFEFNENKSNPLTYKKIIKYYDDLENENENNGDFYFSKGEALYKFAKNLYANESNNEIKKNNDESEKYWQESRTYFIKSLECYESDLSNNIGDIKILNKKGIVLFNLSFFWNNIKYSKDALDSFERALLKDKKNSVILNNIGVASFKLSNFCFEDKLKNYKNESEKHYKDALIYDENNGYIQNNYAIYLHDSKDHEGAEKYYLKAIENDKEFCNIYYCYGLLLLWQANFTNAKKQFEEAKKYDKTLKIYAEKIIKWMKKHPSIEI